MYCKFFLFNDMNECIKKLFQHNLLIIVSPKQERLNVFEHFEKKTIFVLACCIEEVCGFFVIWQFRIYYYCKLFIYMSTVWLIYN